MIIQQHLWMASKGWNPGFSKGNPRDAQLVLVFGSPSLLRNRRLIEDIKETYSAAMLFGSSTAGEIFGARVFDDTLTATAIHWEHTGLRFASEMIKNAEDSITAGRRLAEHFDRKHLRHVFVLSEGLQVNGSELVRGLTEGLPSQVSITGGLAGDGDRFGETYVLWNDQGESNRVAAVGFYGEGLQVGYGSFGGWDPFGPERLVTRSRGNILYEMDGKSALHLYKRYLGDQAVDLPASGLLFPLSLRAENSDRPLVRTLLAVNEEDKSMTFAGDIPEGSYARLMKANFDRLIDGAAEAAKMSCDILGSFKPELVILISCVGRKLILKQRIEEEIEEVRDVLGNDACYTGFYSYGEISPSVRGANCELHNQTMTITAFAEGKPHA
ncbi:MAG: FIST N-terminal domain-containing protein [Syntrophales bacterium]|jgi:hypothetical protein